MASSQQPQEVEWYTCEKLANPIKPCCIQCKSTPTVPTVCNAEQTAKEGKGCNNCEKRGWDKCELVVTHYRTKGDENTVPEEQYQVQELSIEQDRAEIEQYFEQYFGQDSEYSTQLPSWEEWLVSDTVDPPAGLVLEHPEQVLEQGQQVPGTLGSNNPLQTAIAEVLMLCAPSSPA